MGQVRIPVTVDKAEQALRELRGIATGVRGIETATRSSTATLQQIGQAFTPFRRNLEVVNQLRGAYNQLYGAIGYILQGYRALISHNAELNSRFQATERSMDQLVTSFARGVESTGEISNGLGAINNILLAMPRLAEGAGVAFVSLMRTAAQQATATLTGNPLLGQLLTLALAEGAEAIANQPQRAGEQSVAAAREKMMENLRNQNRATQQYLERQAEHFQEEKERRRRGGANAARERDELRAWAGESEARERTHAIEKMLTAEYREQTIALRETLNNLTLVEEIEQRRQAAAILYTNVKREEEEKATAEYKLQAEAEQELARQREERVGDFIGQMGSIANATQNLGKTIASAYEAMGGSSEKAKKVEGAFVVAYSSVMAALELAESIRAFAKQDYVSGALHLVGMAAYIAAAVEAGSQLGGGAAKTPSAQTSYQAARTEGLGEPSGEQQGNTIVNQYSWGRSKAEAAEAVADIEYEGARTGRVRRTDSSMWGA